MLRSALSDPLPDVIEAEVCVVGGGPAGIVTALELSKLGVKVSLIEAGGTDGPGDGEESYAGTSSGRPYPIQGSRLRWLGGTTNHWGGWVRPLDPIDFLDSPKLNLPAWPIGFSNLESWYKRADAWCEVAPGGYDFERLGLGQTEHVLDLPMNEEFRHEFFRVSPPTRFGQRYREDIAADPELDCWTNLTVAELRQSSESVREMRARTTSGLECRLRADFFVLAMGGLEIPRLLLSQDNVPGNQANLVGRCFMDHFGVRPGRLLAAADLRYRLFEWQGESVIPVMRPSDELLMDDVFGNACISLAATRPQQSLPPAYWENRAVSSLTGQAALTYDVTIINEPFPDPRSHITLIEERDGFGLPRMNLHWHLPVGEFDRVMSLVERFRNFVGRAGLGRFQWVERQGLPEDQIPGVGYHHMGTTRMSADPQYGVTDPDCRVWDRDNLYIASSSLFPTAGYANPTLTICALASRLAFHLAARTGHLT